MMGFRSADFTHLAKFNSAASSNLLDIYNTSIDEEIATAAAEPAHRTFAPSSFRCDRRSWFRLRGVQPDKVKEPDRVLQFAADMGTACHRVIQRRLQNKLGQDWIDVSSYLVENPINYQYTLTRSEDSLETFVQIQDPPVRFACDGIIRLDNRYYLLEIKTVDYDTWSDLTDPMPKHIDQVQCYCALLGLSQVMFIYQDRQYGEIKSYELAVPKYEVEAILSRMKHVQDMVAANLAPDPLPKGDSWCTPAMCPYYQRCGDWGR